MRKICPVCGSNERYTQEWDLAIPSGWTLPSKNTICCCKYCGFIYYDSTATQKDYDDYYKTRYGYGLYGSPIHEKRLADLAEYIAQNFDPDIKVVDFGGGDGFLLGKLRALGFTNLSSWDIGGETPRDCDLVVASHVIEHIYDLREGMKELGTAAFPDGSILVEVPDAVAISHLKQPPILDYNFVHINHFTPFSLDLLFSNFCFTMTHSMQVHYAANNSTIMEHCYRAVYTIDPTKGPFFSSIKTITENMDYLAKQLSEIKEPFIVWGAGGIMMKLVAHGTFPIAYFVDRDTVSFPPGTTINGIPVYDKVHSGEPIVVCAFGQADGILQEISNLELQNKVIRISGV